MYHIRKYYSISSFQTIPEREDTTDDIAGQEVKTTKRIPREADFLTYSCDSYCLKIQSGGDFVCHILQKMKTVWLALFLFEMLPQQDFVFYPVIIIQIDFHYYKGNDLRTLQNYI